MDILQTDTMVNATANRGKNYTVFFREKAPILVQVNFRSRHGSGEEYAGYRKLWERGDERLSLTAHCAINAAKAQIFCDRCNGDGYQCGMAERFCDRCNGTGLRSHGQSADGK